MAKGYTKRPRYIEELGLMGETEPFDKVHAYDYLLAKCNIEKKTFPLRGSKKMQTVDRGQLFTSIDKLSKAWRWSKNKVRTYIDMLKGMGLLQAEGTADGTLLTLVKYDDDGIQPQAEGTTQRTAKGTAKGTTEGTRLKKDKNSLKEYKEQKKRAQRGLNPWEGDPE